MRNILILSLLLSIMLSSCGSETSLTPEKQYKTFVTKNGSLVINDTIIASIEGGTTSDLAFKAGGRISDILVRPGERVKAGQILARLGNQESSIQMNSLSNIEQELIDLGLTTNAVRIGTEDMVKSLSKVYDKRIAGMDNNILSLQNTLQKAKQNLGNETSTLAKTFATFAHDFDRVSSNMLYEGDKILGLTTNFEYANDAWEPYLGVRVGNTKVDTDNKWGVLYGSRGKIRAYIESGATIPEINKAITDLKDAYNNARLFTSSMNDMLQNSVVGGGLPEEKLTGWTTLWSGFSSDEQQSEARFITWNNTILNLTEQGGTGSVAQKDIIAIELELKSLEISRETLVSEKELKLKEMKTNVDTIKSKRGEVSIQIEQTRMNTSLARESLEYNIIRAPFDGIVLEKYMSVGNVVATGLPIMKVSSRDKTMIKTYIDNDMYKYTVGDVLTLQNSATEETLSGTITLLQKEKDPLHNKNYTEIELKNASEALGERVVIKLARTKTPFQNGMIVPLSSIITRYGPPGVFVIQDDKAVFTLVKIIGSDLSLAEVIGVPEGSVLITDGKENIIDGEMLDAKKMRQEK